MEALSALNSTLLASLVMLLAFTLTMVVGFLIKRILGLLDDTASTVEHLQTGQGVLTQQIINLERHVFRQSG
ncbi:MAG: hypothetical protein KUG74_01055 [Rhodobacteraceae bacterium]|nr:hypothetical protein [Paracoccaceae bacterium]